uniref:Secreted protein n=1 Tax=Macrostomum lignano TaxID=282301 RepID=A0A1I8GWD5_9PLAT
ANQRWLRAGGRRRGSPGSACFPRHRPGDHSNRPRGGRGKGDKNLLPGAAAAHLRAKPTATSSQRSSHGRNRSRQPRPQWHQWLHSGEIRGRAGRARWRPLHGLPTSATPAACRCPTRSHPAVRHLHRPALGLHLWLLGLQPDLVRDAELQAVRDPDVLLQEVLHYHDGVLPRTLLRHLRHVLQQRHQGNGRRAGHGQPGSQRDQPGSAGEIRGRPGRARWRPLHGLRVEQQLQVLHLRPVAVLQDRHPVLRHLHRPALGLHLRLRGLQRDLVHDAELQAVRAADALHQAIRHRHARVLLRALLRSLRHVLQQHHRHQQVGL